MDNQRLLIWAACGVLLWMTYQAWQQDYGPQPATSTATDTSTTPEATTVPGELPAARLPASPDELPDLDAGVAPAPAAQSDAPVGAATVRVITDVLDVTISTRGGTLLGATLLRYPVAKDRPEELVTLLRTDANDVAELQTGLRAGTDSEPNHLALFNSAQSEYRLTTGADQLEVPLTWSNEAGIAVTKVFRFNRGSYIIPVEQTVTNNSSEAWKAAAYTQIRHSLKELERSMFDVDSYSFTGPVIYDGEKSEKLDRKDLTNDGPLQLSGVSNGWLASIQHHFLIAAIPPADIQHSYKIASAGDNYRASAVGTSQTVGPGATATFSSTMFVGPKLQSQLEQVTDSLKLTVDYGWLTIISQPLFWLLSLVYSFVANWGVAIILVTVLIKLAFYKLTQKSGRSMAKMRAIQPRMKALQDRYKDDRQQLSQAMMELYKREKVNPAAGCLPILIQMPFFLAFYWVLLESVEMRQAPFMLWIKDLSTHDPLFILPLLMGAGMYFQQKLNPAPADPVQAKVMAIMPVIFTGFFAFFPAGLVLYWFTNTLLSIAQQWRINKVVEMETKKVKK